MKSTQNWRMNIEILFRGGGPGCSKANAPMSTQAMLAASELLFMPAKKPDRTPGKGYPRSRRWLMSDNKE